mmetsp:Transcript_5326/g.15626  ORF Transcript_5326/g.15626 Transcript_5326/m.15626 type:complete len:116 (+) Transcript_5326:68-415(+)
MMSWTIIMLTTSAAIPAAPAARVVLMSVTAARAASWFEPRSGTDHALNPHWLNHSINAPTMRRMKHAAKQQLCENRMTESIVGGGPEAVVAPYRVHRDASLAQGPADEDSARNAQ